MSRHSRKLIVVGDRVLVRPDEGAEKTAVGLYLPQTVLDKDAVQGGTIVSIGPGISLPDPINPDDEPWKRSNKIPHHIPMQAREGDYAIFLRKAAVEIKYDDKTYLVVPQSAILVLLRDDEK
jgi:co-chaperonin GroES (HSP10)